MISRQALAGMLWSKQYYALDMEQWLAEHGADPLLPGPGLRNHEWQHLISEDIISMPDKWEYPWFAAWDLAFHAVALAAVDMPFAKHQLELLLDHRYLHPNGQLPAYEWNFSDVNPPVHAWATWFVYSMDKAKTGHGDRVFLESTFQKLMRNFGWWLNRKDADDRNIFQGGFLGLDNIGVFDRSAPLPGGGRIDQADGTAWMTLYSQNMLQMAVELGRENPVYQEQALALLENWAWIAAATNHVGPDDVGLWDEEDGFFYDVLRRPDGSSVPLKVRSVVGLMPLVAATVITAAAREEFPQLAESAIGFLAQHPALSAALPEQGRQAHRGGPVLLAMFNEERLRRILTPDARRGGIPRAARHSRHLPVARRASVRAEPGRSGVQHQLSPGRVRHRHVRRQLQLARTGVDADQHHAHPRPAAAAHVLRRRVHGRMPDGLGSAEEPVPGGGGDQRTADRRLPPGLRRAPPGPWRRAAAADRPHWRDLVLFYEYYHGDNGAGIGASHQTGWSGTVGVLPLLFRGGRKLDESGWIPAPRAGESAAGSHSRRR